MILSLFNRQRILMLFKIIKIIGLFLIANAVTFQSCRAVESKKIDLLASASVIARCSINTTPINFGIYKPKTTAEASGSVTITCTKGTKGISVTLDSGKNSLGGFIRRMKNDRDSHSFLTYELYKPPNNIPGTGCSHRLLSIWGASGSNSFDLTQAPSRVSRTYNICGRIPATPDNAKVSVGYYTDVVNATVIFSNN